MSDDGDAAAYTATGPPQSTSGHPFSAVSTRASHMRYGVNVQGEVTGVYAESVIGGTPRESHIDSGGIGVYGVGDVYGVFGRIKQGNRALAAVVGRHDGAGIGTIGAALDRPGPRKGIGVVGISNTTVTDASFQTLPDPARGSGTGVYGTSGSGPGVRGTSRSGSGVVGESQTSAGGEFKSGPQHAQVHLVPHAIGGSLPAPTAVPSRERKLAADQLPRNGKIGDLLLTEHDDAVGCILWVCVRGSTRGQARWAQVLLGTPIKGTHPVSDE